MSIPAAATTSISTASQISLRIVDETNWRAVVNLKPSETQRGLVATNAFSLVEAQYEKDEVVRAIYADDTPVGMIVMSIEEHDDWYGIFRFMLDARYQRMGFGKQALDLAVRFIRDTYPGASFIRLWAAIPGGAKDVQVADAPFGFYKKSGFWQVSGQVNDDGEVEMRYTLRS